MREKKEERVTSIAREMVVKEVGDVFEAQSQRFWEFIEA